MGQGGDNDITGGTCDDIIITGNGNDVINGTAGNNYIDPGHGHNQVTGGSGNDTIILHADQIHTDYGFIDGGIGDNTLIFADEGVSLDLVHDHPHVNNIQHIDTNGNGEECVILDSNGVKEITGDNNTLTITGEDGDQIRLSGNWQHHEPAVINGNTYNHYSLDGATVYTENVEVKSYSLVIGSNEPDHSDPMSGLGDLQGEIGNNIIVGDPGGLIDFSANPTVNACLLLDISNSMGDEVSPSVTRLDVLKASVNHLLDQYEQMAEQGATINVDILAFNHETNEVGKLQLNADNPSLGLSEMKDTVNAIENTGGTKFTYAMNSLQEHLAKYPVNGENEHTTVYLISDGSPMDTVYIDHPYTVLGWDVPFMGTTELMWDIEAFNRGIDTHEWASILENPNIQVHGVGISEDADMDVLAAIDNTQDGVFRITDLSDTSVLTEALSHIAVNDLQVAEPQPDVIHGGDGQNVIIANMPGHTVEIQTETGTHFAGHDFDSLAAAFEYDLDKMADFLLDPTDNYANAQILLDPGHGASDTIYGDSGSNLILAQGGNNEIFGGDGDDVIFSGNGNSHVTETHGNNYIDAGHGENTIMGGDGDDTVVIYQDSLYQIDGSFDGGMGDNTLRFADNGGSFDFTQDHADIANFTHFDLTGDDNQTLTLALSDILDVSGESNSIFIDGNHTDTVKVLGSWDYEGRSGSETTQYQHYASGDANLYVDSEMSQVVSVNMSTIDTLIGQEALNAAMIV